MPVDVEATAVAHAAGRRVERDVAKVDHLAAQFQMIGIDACVQHTDGDAFAREPHRACLLDAAHVGPGACHLRLAGIAASGRRCRHGKLEIRHDHIVVVEHLLGLTLQPFVGRLDHVGIQVGQLLKIVAHLRRLFAHIDRDQAQVGEPFRHFFPRCTGGQRGAGLFRLGTFPLRPFRPGFPA